MYEYEVKNLRVPFDIEKLEKYELGWSKLVTLIAIILFPIVVL